MTVVVTFDPVGNPFDFATGSKYTYRVDFINGDRALLNDPDYPLPKEMISMFTISHGNSADDRKLKLQFNSSWN